MSNHYNSTFASDERISQEHHAPHLFDYISWFYPYGNSLQKLFAWTIIHIVLSVSNASSSHI